MTTFQQVDAGVRAFEVSPYPEERFIAAGTEKGTIYVFEKENLLQGHSYIYARFNPHKSWIRGMSIIKNADTH